MPIITNAEVIRERLTRVREIMSEKKVDLYVVETGDYHMSEYVGDFFAEREFISGFTGSAGTMVITMDKAALFTDGRYFVQAQLQIEDTGIELMRMGYKNVPTLEQFCQDECKEHGCISFDGRTVGAGEGLTLQEAAKEKNGTIDDSFDAIEQIWTERPAFPASKVYELGIEYAGKSRKDKLSELREDMKKQHADAHVIATLDDICWLFNLRAADVECNPVMMSFALITRNETRLYVEKERLDDAVLASLQKDNVMIRPYGAIYDEVAGLRDCSILIDPTRVNMKLYRCIDSSVQRLTAMNPTVLSKSKKNQTELQNLREIHVQDGLAVTRIMYWLKKSMESESKTGNGQGITEASAAAYVDHLRSEIEGYIVLSFGTISAYNANAAMMHYHATEDNCAQLKPEGMLLVDSGGQYLKGTTDVTRTFALGPVTDQMKKHFTLTLKGMLTLTHAHFLKGCTGINLDILARAALWNEGIDYRCGTGHGIGYLLNVHEGPNGIRWKNRTGVDPLCEFDEGMVTSNEPGVYIDGEYGIRIENEIACRTDYENEYGTFMKFETLTMVPIDLDLVDKNYLSDQDVERLNEYHQMVYENLKPYLKDEELDFLEKYTRAI